MRGQGRKARKKQAAPYDERAPAPRRPFGEVRHFILPIVSGFSEARIVLSAGIARRAPKGCGACLAMLLEC